MSNLDLALNRQGIRATDSNSLLRLYDLATEALNSSGIQLERQRADFANPDGTGSPRDACPAPARRALATFCQALLSSNAFLYVD